MAESMLKPDDRIVDLPVARQSIYGFWAACFTRPPTESEVEMVRSGEIQGMCVEIFRHEWDGALPTETVIAESQEDINQEFMELFKIPGAKYLTPYESVYRDSREIEGKTQRGLLMGQAVLDVQKWYRLAAVELESGCKELPDHIGLLLAYVAHLCRKEQEFDVAGDTQHLYRAREMQRDFLAAHVGSWLGALRDKLYEKSTSVHYRTIVDLALGFVRSDLASLERELGLSARSSVPPYQDAPAGGSSHEQE